MSPRDEFIIDPAFLQAMEGVRSALRILPGIEIPAREAEMIATFTLVAFVKAGGLSEPSLGRLTRFAPELSSGR